MHRVVYVKGCLCGRLSIWKVGYMESCIHGGLYTWRVVNVKGCDGMLNYISTHQCASLAVAPSLVPTVRG